MIATVQQFAARIALDEGYTWQKHPNAAQSKKQGKYEKRARTYFNLVLGGRLEPVWEGNFATFEDWVNCASRFLRDSKNVDANGMTLAAVCVDADGRRCVSGADFMRARDEKKFPVRFFFRMADRDTLKNNLPEKKGLP